MSVNKRMDAASKGELKYLGNPCKRGHEGWRYTQSGACIECNAAANKDNIANIGKLLAAAKK